MKGFAWPRQEAPNTIHRMRKELEECELCIRSLEQRALANAKHIANMGSADPVIAEEAKELLRMSRQTEQFEWRALISAGKAARKALRRLVDE